MIELLAQISTTDASAASAATTASQDAFSAVVASSGFQSFLWYVGIVLLILALAAPAIFKKLRDWLVANLKSQVEPLLSQLSTGSDVSPKPAGKGTTPVVPDPLVVDKAIKDRTQELLTIAPNASTESHFRWLSSGTRPTDALIEYTKELESRLQAQNK